MSNGSSPTIRRNGPAITPAPSALDTVAGALVAARAPAGKGNPARPTSAAPFRATLASRSAMPRATSCPPQQAAASRPCKEAHCASCDAQAAFACPSNQINTITLGRSMPLRHGGSTDQQRGSGLNDFLFPDVGHVPRNVRQAWQVGRRAAASARPVKSKRATTREDSTGHSTQNTEQAFFFRTRVSLPIFDLFSGHERASTLRVLETWT
jgi:hypothetical protein